MKNTSKILALLSAGTMLCSSAFAATTTVTIDEKTKEAVVVGEGYVAEENVMLLMVNSDIDVSEITTQNAKSSISYAYGIKADADGEYELRIPLDDRYGVGKYNIIAHGEVSESTSTNIPSFYYVSDGEKEELLAKLNATEVAAADCATLRTYISFEAGYLSDGTNATKYEQSINSVFVRMRNEQSNDKFADFADAKKTYFLAAAEVLMINSAPDCSQKVLECLVQANESISDTTKKYISVICANISNYEIVSKQELLKAIETAAAVEDINNMKRSEIEAGLSKYSVVLGIKDTSDYNKYLALDSDAKATVNAKLYQKGFKSDKELRDALKAALPKGNQGGAGGGLGFGGGGGGGASGGGFTTVDESYAEEPEKAIGTRFMDLQGYEWAEDAIEVFRQLGFINGKTEQNFSPADNVTRAEFVKIVTNAFDIVDETAECNLEDCAKDDWFYIYVASAEKSGIVKGDGIKFRPNDYISRQDIAVILGRIADMLERELNSDSGENIFDDDEYISSYAKDSVYSMRNAGIVTGDDTGVFRPLDNASRAEAVVMIYRLFKGE